MVFYVNMVVPFICKKEIAISHSFLSANLGVFFLCILFPSFHSIFFVLVSYFYNLRWWEFKKKVVFLKSSEKVIC